MSLWTETAEIKSDFTHKQPIKTDVLIVGGGITGVLCAHRLRKMGLSCIVSEADSICNGTTKNTTAKITSQHGLVYHKLIHTFGAEKARMYYDANEKAIDEYRKMCSDIDCDFEEKDSYIYSRNNRNALESEAAAVEKLGIKADLTDNLPLPITTVGAVRFGHQAQFHPLKFINAVARNIDIIENTKVIEICGNVARTNRGHISAEHIIIATHFPFINKHGSYFMKLYQSRSYVIALENADDYDGMYADEDEKGFSFRNYNNYLLLGGGGHRTGKDGCGWDKLREFAVKNYPRAKEVSHWAAQDCMSLDSIPYIGKYSKRTGNLYVASGFNKWGMTSAMIASMVLSDMITGRKNEYEELFSPSRSMLHPQLALNLAESAKNLLTPTAKRCPHLGCALKWNKNEHSLDCPCHGSRFDKDGKLIDNPATGNMKHR